MKKKWMAAAAIAVMLLVGMTTAFAADGGLGRHFADTDGDGVCDNAGTNCGVNYVDADGDGVCDNAGTNCGRYYVDDNGDGICDNMGSGVGQGRGHHGRHGGCRW